MRTPGTRTRLAVTAAAAVVLAAAALVALNFASAVARPSQPARHETAGKARPDRDSPATRGPLTGRASASAATAGPPAGAPGPAGSGGRPGVLGSYRVSQARFRFIEPARAGPSGQRLGPRTLLTLVRYPAVWPDRGRSRPASGPFPLIVFGPGFQQCGGPYADLLRAWASAGYVVAVVNFPRSDCLAGTAAIEADLINQPGDVSYEITRLLAASAGRHGLLARLINPGEVAVAGQSDGGDTVAAVAANSCCADRRVKAFAVLSGAEWAPMPGRYFAGRTPPMLLVQGSADQVNPPAVSRQLYQADRSRARYYLDLFGVGHMTPYVGTNPVERLTARVTVAFFDRWVLGQLAAGPRIVTAGTVPGVARLVHGRAPPPR